MGQYYYTVNLDKREYLNPHKLGDGLKIGEQVGSAGGVASALLILLACSNGRGGGDLGTWHDYSGAPRDTSMGEGTFPPDEKEVIGRWAGDRIAVVGDYAEVGDYRADRVEDRPDLVYSLCATPEEIQEDANHYLKVASGYAVEGRMEESRHFEEKARLLTQIARRGDHFVDITELVIPIVERECEVTISGEGWRTRAAR